MTLDQSTVVTPALRQRLAEEASYGPHLAYFEAEGAAHTLKSPGAISPEPMQDVIARDILQALNKDLAFDGTWLVALTDLPCAGIILTEPTYGCMRFLWMDRDGDVQFTVEVWDPPIDIAMAGMQHWQQSAHDAWQQWHHQREVLDLSEDRGEIKRVAKGEAKTPAPVAAESIIGD